MKHNTIQNTHAAKHNFIRLQKVLSNETWCKINKMNCELMLTYDTPALRQTGSRNLMGPKRFPQYGVPIWSLWRNIRFLPSIFVEKNPPKNEHTFNVYKNQQSRQTGSRNLMGPKRFPRYGVPIWSLWPNIGSLLSIVAEKNVQCV